MRTKISRWYAYLAILVVVSALTGCGGAGTKKSKTEVPALPSLQAGQTIIIASGARGLQPDLTDPPAITILPTSESSSPGDTVVVWTTLDGLRGATYYGSKVRISNITLASTTESSDAMAHPSVRSLPDGKFFVVWEKKGSVLGKFFQPTGIPFGKEISIAPNGRASALATSKDGKIYVLYEGDDLRLHIATPSFNTTTPETISIGEDLGERLKNQTGPIHYHPGIAVDGKGNILVTWAEKTEIRGNLTDAPNGRPNFAARMAADGKPDSRDIRLDKTTLPRIPDFPGLLALASGWVVAIKDTNANEKTLLGGAPLPSAASDLMAKCESFLMLTFLNDKAEAIGSPIRMDTSGKVLVSVSNIAMGKISQRDWGAAIPGMARDKDGNIFLVWTDFRSGKAEIYGRMINSTGTQTGSEIKIGDGMNGRVAFDGFNFQAVWTSVPNTSESQNSIFLRTYTIQE